MDHGWVSGQTRQDVASLQRSEWIRLLEKEDYSVARIAKRLGVNRGTVSKYLHLNGLQARPRWRYRSHERWAEILAPYTSTREAAKALGLTQRSLTMHLWKHKIPHPFRSNTRDGGLLAGIDAEEFEAIYHANGGNSRKVGDLLGVTRDTARLEAKRRGLR